MKKYLYTFLLLFIFVHLQAQKNFVIKNEQWLQYVNIVHFSKTLSLNTDLDYRWKENLSLKSQYIFRSGLGYNVNNRLQLLLGFAHLGFYSNQTISRLEYRPYEQLSYKHQYNKLKLAHRLRIEQRYFYRKSNEATAGSTSFNYRFRYRFAVRMPIFKSEKISLGISNEIHLNARKENTSSPFDQNRLIIGPAYSFSKKLAVNLYYQNLISPTSIRNEYNLNHMVFISLKHVLNLY